MKVIQNFHFNGTRFKISYNAGVVVTNCTSGQPSEALSFYVQLQGKISWHTSHQIQINPSFFGLHSPFLLLLSLPPEPLEQKKGANIGGHRLGKILCTTERLATRHRLENILCTSERLETCHRLENILCTIERLAT